MNLNDWVYSGPTSPKQGNYWITSTTTNIADFKDPVVEIIKEFDRSSEDDQIEMVYRNIHSLLAIHEPFQATQDYVMDHRPNYFGMIQNPSLETCEKAIEIDYNNGYFINFNNYPNELYQKWKMCLYS